MSKNSQKPNQVVTESGTGNDGVRHSNQDISQIGGSQMASPEQLALALDLSQQANAAKDEEIARLKAALAQQTPSQSVQNSDDIILKLADAIKLASQPAQPAVNMENINRAADFQNTKTTVDGRSLMEAQQVLQAFKNEKKIPISISKSYTHVFGPNLTVTVNGVRVSVPCDGKTYYINETHAEHIRERLVKVDIYNADESSLETITG